MGILSSGRFWVGVAVGAIVVPMVLPKLKAKLPS